jgi:hypothetical protein
MSEVLILRSALLRASRPPTLLRNFGAMYWLAEPKPTGRRLVRDGAEEAPPHQEVSFGGRTIELGRSFNGMAQTPPTKRYGRSAGRILRI